MWVLIFLFSLFSRFDLMQDIFLDPVMSRRKKKKKQAARFIWLCLYVSNMPFIRPVYITVAIKSVLNTNYCTPSLSIDLFI